VTTKSYGQTFAFLSLLCSLSFWFALGLSYAPRLPQLNSTPRTALLLTRRTIFM
jgi:hypothetical protein